MKNIMLIILVIVLLLLIVCGIIYIVSISNSKESSERENQYLRVDNETYFNSESTKIRLSFNNEEIIIKMEDNESSKDFLSMLPLDFKFEDYNGTEKISYLPRKIDVTNAAGGIEPQVGDFTYYYPWGNLAIFYNDFSYSNSLIKLGTIEVGIEKLHNIKNNSIIRIEKIN